jgi:hypothetical protein
VHIGFWWEELGERDHFEDLGLHGRIILKCICKKRDGKSWIGFVLHRMGTAAENL